MGAGELKPANETKRVLFADDVESNATDAGAASSTPDRKPKFLPPLSQTPSPSAGRPTPSASALQMSGLSGPTSDASALQMLERVEKTIASIETKKDNGKLSTSKVAKAELKLKKLRAKKEE